MSSVLRTPGTHNRKDGGERLVVCGPFVGPYQLEDFHGLLAGTPQAHAAAPGKHSVLTAAALNLYGEPDANPESIARQCKQIARFIVKYRTLPEPAWYAGLGVLAHCLDGDAFAHRFSQDYEGYTFAETQARLDRSRNFGPTTCAHFAAIDPEYCEGCPHKAKITSPIQLGRTHSRYQEQGRANGERAPEIAPGATAPPGSSQFVTVDGFTNSIEKGLVAIRETNKGALIDVTVSRHPIWLRSLQVNETDSQQHNVVFAMLVSGRYHELVLSLGTLASQGGIPELSRQGAVIHQSDEFKRYTRHAVDQWRLENRPMEIRYDQFGWKDGDTSFLCGDRLYSASGIRRVTGSAELTYRAQFLCPRDGGSLDGWSAAANKLFAANSEAQSFGLLCGFAACIMRFHSVDEGGAIASFVNQMTGTGKSTVLKAAASIWGRLKGIKIYDDDTKVAKGLKLGLFGNLPMTYDELSKRDPEIIREFVLMFTNATDRDRGRPDGTLVHNQAEWQTILLLASNKPIVDLLSNIQGESDAQAYRILEFHTELPEGAKTKEGDEITRQLEINSGYAGDAFLRILTRPEVLSAVKAAIPRVTDMVWERTGLDNKFRFWVRMIASVIIAGRIVQQHGILEFSVERITKWILDYVKQTAMNTIPENQVDLVTQFISHNFNSMLTVSRAWRPHTTTPPIDKPTSGKLMIRYEMEEERMAVSEMDLRKWLLERGVHRAKFESDLARMGVLIAKRSITMGAGTIYAGAQVPAYIFNLAHPAMGGVLAEVAQRREAVVTPFAK